MKTKNKSLIFTTDPNSFEDNPCLEMFNRFREGIENVKRVLILCGIRLDYFDGVHIVGTNGKGTTAYYTYHYLKNFIKKIGVFTSPHIIHDNERIKINGINIPDNDFERLKLYFGTLENEFDVQLTYFELMFCIALKYFKDNEVDFIVIEAGLGARFDVTSILKYDTLVVTSISKDHQNYLGSRLYDIISEKLCHIDEYKTVVIYPQSKYVVRLIRQYIRQKKKKNSHIVWVKNKFKLYNIKENKLCLRTRNNDTVWFNSLNIKLFQSVLTADEIKNIVIKDYIRNDNIKSISIIKPPFGRMTFFENNKYNFIFDTAHNIEGISYLMKIIKSLLHNRYKKIRLFFALSKDKKCKPIFNEISSVDEDVYYVNYPVDRLMRLVYRDSGYFPVENSGMTWAGSGYISAENSGMTCGRSSGYFKNKIEIGIDRFKIINNEDILSYLIKGEDTINIFFGTFYYINYLIKQTNISAIITKFFPW